MNIRNRLILTLSVLTASLAGEAHAGLIITPTFTSGFNSSFGANAAAAQASWISAASVFASNFNDNIHINLTVDGVAGTSVFGQSNTLGLITNWSTLRSKVVADAKTADDAIAVGTGGSITAADPAGGSGNWFVARAQAKALGLITDDLANDGTTTFGAGHSFTFSGNVAIGTYDFKGIAEHEISEVMGRLGIKSTATRTLIDAYAFTGVGTRDLVGGANNNFSLDNGTTLLKLWNNPASNGLDSRDWAPGTNDAFNQFSYSGVVNSVSGLDLRLMDALGYDLAQVPDPANSGVLFATTLIGLTLLTKVGTKRRATL